jgi:hypothetical protein
MLIAEVIGAWGRNLKILMVFLLLLPQVSAAGVFLCVDPQTGKKTFTDRACEESASSEQVRIRSTNTTSGARTAGGSGNGTWNSDRDESRTGLEYREEERVQKGTASADGTFQRPGYLGAGY